MSAENQSNKFEIFKKKLIPLFSFNTIAQVLPIVFLPLLANLYLPEAIGQITLFNSISLLIAEFGSLKFDQAIIISKNKKEAIGLFSLSVLLTFAISLIVILLSVAVVFFFDINLNILLFGSLGLTGLIFFISIVLNQLNKSFFLYYNRFVKIRAMSVLTVLPIFFYNAIAVGLGFFFPKIETLVVVKLLSFILVFTLLVYTSRKKISKNLKNIDSVFMKDLIKSFMNYPKYILPGKMLNIITLKSVDILIASFFGSALLGQFALARRYVMVPETTISKAISDVFRRQGFRSDGTPDSSKIRSLFNKYFKVLIALGVLIFSITYWIVPFVVDLLLGEDWDLVVPFARILLFGFAFSFIISPLTSIVRTFNREKLETVFQLFFILLLGIFATVTWYFNLGMDEFVVLLSTHRGLSFMFLGVILIFVLKKSK